MVRHSYLTRRNGVFYYKRPVPKELQAPCRPKQIWKSLRTSDERRARIAYRAIDGETDALFEAWGKGGSATSTDPGLTRLSPALVGQLTDAHRLAVTEDDFRWRGSLWVRVQADPGAFRAGNIVPLPTSDAEYSFYDHLDAAGASLEELFLCCVAIQRREKLHRLRLQHRLGDFSGLVDTTAAMLKSRDLNLSDDDRARLARRLLEAEISALEALVADDGLRTPEQPIPEALPNSGDAMSSVLDKYIEVAGRELEWTAKDALRWRGHLNEFLEIAGDKPVNRYTRADGVLFKDTQLALPSRRGVKPFRGLGLIAAAKLAGGKPDVELLSPTTINDKIGCVSRFFVWARSRDDSVVNPVDGLAVKRKKRGRNKERFPWRTDELNTMFQAPIYTGCHSLRRWRDKGNFVPRQSAMFWVPLIGLFSGMRLGEIIQLHVADVKTRAGISYFDVTTILDDDEVKEQKSLKTATSRRGVPIHKTLFDVGFADFLEYRKRSGADRLFPDFGQAKDDGSWSKPFSKHFKRFRDSIGVTRRGVVFHSLRHNVEDALRNADVRKEVRDAVQGHEESGVSREYGSGHYVETLNEAVQKIRYAGLRLPGLVFTPSIGMNVAEE